jgi:septum formation protein
MCEVPESGSRIAQEPGPILRQPSTAPPSAAPVPLVLASASPARQALLRAAGVAVSLCPARLDEAAIARSLAAEGVAPRDIADALAEAKAIRIGRRPELAAAGAVVIGCDQVLDLDGRVLEGPCDIDALRAQLRALRGRRHRLYSAVVLSQHGTIIWRHVGGAEMAMRMASDAYLDAYVARHGAGLLGAAGGYRIEEEGIRLFERIDGDHFTVLGLPLLPLLGYLGARGWIAA